jgi:hypothetical protein
VHSVKPSTDQNKNRLLLHNHSIDNFFPNPASELMRDGVHDDTIRQTIVEVIEMLKKARVGTEGEEVEVEQEAEGESSGEMDEHDEEIENVLWGMVRKVLAIIY